MFPAFEKYRIVTLSALILLALTLAAGISVYVVMQRQAESLLSKNLAVSLQSNVRLFESRIDYALSDTQTAATRPSIIKNLQLLASKPGSTTGRDELRQVAISLLPIGITGLSIYDVRGHEVVRAGHLSQKHDLRVPLKSNIHAVLLWDGQFILQASMDVLDQQGRRIGSIMTEASLPPLTRALADVASIGKTGDLAVCAPLADDEKNMACFPSRISVKVFKLFARVVEGKPLPMNHALNGETGIIFARDYRREQVVAAYAPVGAFGLGMVIKIDREELYQPVTEQLKFITPLLAALVMAGMLLLNFLVRPLVQKLVDAERTTRQLHTELSQFKNTLDQTLDCVFMFDPESLRFTYVNKGAILQVGYSETELLQMTAVDFKPLFTLAQFRQAIQPLIDGVQPSLTFQTVHRHKDGHDVPVESFLQLVRLEGQPPRFVAMVSDITERKQAEEKLRDKNQLLDSIVDNIPSVIFLKRASDLRYELWNRAGEVLLGKGRNELVGCNDYDIFPKEQADFFIQKDREALGQNEIVDIPEEIAESPHGTRVFHTKKLVLKDSHGQPQYLLGIAEDITERKLAEEEIRVQLNELLRWQKVMLDREGRVQQLKAEINELLRQRGEAVRYPSQADI